MYDITKIKKGDIIIYRHYKGWTPRYLRVVCRIPWEGIGFPFTDVNLTLKCKVLSKDWYKIVHLTPCDFMNFGGHIRAVPIHIHNAEMARNDIRNR